MTGGVMVKCHVWSTVTSHKTIHGTAFVLLEQFLYRDGQPCSQSNLVLGVGATSVPRASLQTVIGGPAVNAQGSLTCTLPHDLLACSSGIVQLSLSLLQLAPLPRDETLHSCCSIPVSPSHL